jgi:predicted RNA-binding protein with PUA-like domain
MAYWLMKSEPHVYGWAMLVQDGATFWNGVRNHLAKQHLKAMRVGDEAFFYHSNEGKACVGVMRVMAEAAPDDTATRNEYGANGINPWVGVWVEPLYQLSKPVTLAMVKAQPKLANMALLKSARLSVQPVTTAEWVLIKKMGDA